MGNPSATPQQQSESPPSYKLETDYPWVGTTPEEITKFLEKQFLTDKLDRLSPFFWLVSTPKSSHIRRLHHQLVLGREIVITEKGKLHLLWYGNKIFIKPLPPYTFQKSFLGRPEMLEKKMKEAVNGFYRSYGYLIQCPSDLEVAIENKLLPSTWVKQYEEKHGSDGAKSQLFAFLREYRDIRDDKVSRRYRHGGELRLRRLNFYNRLINFELNYHKVHSDYASYFHRFTQPFLFVFGTISVILSAFQAALAARGNTPTWESLPQVANVFSLCCIGLVAVLVCALLLMLVMLIVRESVFAVRKRFFKGKPS
ncbi:hypothetical protein HOY80DRAFT_938250 [Tuber brumale]|nr:hypothetical protein HOY80DRAFT_938250 [Tuber brumale]